MSGSRAGASRAILATAAAATLSIAYVPPLTSLATVGSSHCLLFRTTGLQCPLCGMTRSTVAILRGHPTDALRLNPLAYLFLGYLVWNVACMATSRLEGRARSRRTLAPVLVVLSVGFAVARNLV